MNHPHQSSAKSNDVKSNDVKSNEAKSNDVKSNEAKSNEANSSRVNSNDATSATGGSASRYSGEYLRRVRNEISLLSVIRALNWPHKRAEGRLRFQCPRCEFGHTSINPRTNLGRCFRCEVNFNPIDFVMVAQNYDFLTAVTYLVPLLPSNRPLQP
jgi:hypothetical protein